jgi:GNAT superfamily N-acetyltransferase
VPYVIRPARVDEFALLREVERRAGARFATVGLDDIANGEPVGIEFLSAIALAGAIRVAADGGDRPVGFTLLGILDRAVHVYELDVVPEHGRRGLGARLIEAAAAYASDASLDALTLSTFRDIPWNGPYYERLGFRYLERREWTPALHLLHNREIQVNLPVDRRAFMRKDLP